MPGEPTRAPPPRQTPYTGSSRGWLDRISQENSKPATILISNKRPDPLRLVGSAACHHVAADASGLAEARTEPRGQGARPVVRARCRGCRAKEAEFRLSQHTPSQGSDCPPDCCPEPKRQEQDHDQRRYSDQPRNRSTKPRPIVGGVSAL